MTGKIPAVAHDRMDEGGTAAWTLVQLGALLRGADELLLDGLRTLGPETHAGFPEDASVELAVADVAALQGLLAELADVADELRVLGDCLPDEGVELRYADLRDGAVADLARGMAEPRRALLAARALTLADGWPALAEALRGGDAHADWHETTVAALLRRFRGADAGLVRAVLADAGLNDETTFAACPPERLASLAAALDAHAAGRR
jgi:hypothetical protein